jgi:hypothetical protein
VGTAVRVRNWRECPPHVCVVEAARRIAFVTDLGASPEVRKRELEDEFGRFLAGQSKAFVRSMLVINYITLVDSAASNLEIAQEQLVRLIENDAPGFEGRRQTHSQRYRDRLVSSWHCSLTWTCSWSLKGT